MVELEGLKEFENEYLPRIVYIAQKYDVKYKQSFQFIFGFSFNKINL